MPNVKIIRVIRAPEGTTTEYLADGLLGREPGDLHPSVIAQRLQVRRDIVKRSATR